MITKNLKIQIKQKQEEYKKISEELKLIREIEKENQQKILDQFNFEEEDTSKRIVDPGNDFLMSESDFIDYLKKVFTLHQQKGLNIETYEDDPGYEKEKELKNIENDLIDLAVLTIPSYMEKEKETIEKTKNHWKYRQKTIDLIMRLQV